MSIFRDINCLEQIIYHCQRLEGFRKIYGDSVEQIQTNSDYRDLVILNITQIGENIKNLSPDFKHQHNTVAWDSLRRFRNVVIHEYQTVTADLLYAAITDDVPFLKDFCQKQLDIIMSHKGSEDDGPTPR